MSGEEKIEMGDTVSVFFRSGEVDRDVLVLGTPQDVGDAWKMKSADGVVYYLQFYEAIYLNKKSTETLF